MKRIFSALAVALATLLVIGGDAVVNFGGAAASMTDAAPAVPLTVASVSALPTGTTEPSPETALFSGLLGAAALTAHPGGETAEDALLNNEDAAKAAAAQAAENGAKVIVVEKMPIVGGNSLKATGGMNAADTQYQADLGITDSGRIARFLNCAPTTVTASTTAAW